MVSLDRAMMNSYRLSIITLYLSAAVGRNFECRVSACSHHSCGLNYCILVLIVAFHIAASP